MAACESFRDIHLEQAREPRSLIDVRAQLSEGVASLQQISHALGTMWRQVAYQHFEASACDWYHEATVFRFVTVPGRDAYFVTGAVIITGRHYPKLVEQFEHDFARTHGRLPRLPSNIRIDPTGVSNNALGRATPP